LIETFIWQAAARWKWSSPEEPPLNNCGDLEEEVTGRRAADAATKNSRGGAREFLIVSIRSDVGFYETRAAVSLTDLRQALINAENRMSFGIIALSRKCCGIDI
jgi:hypothetical protein